MESTAHLESGSFEKHRNRTLDDVKAEFQSSYERLLDTINGIPEVDMFEVGRFELTGTGNIAGFILANSANHYRWAKARIRRWIKEGREKCGRWC